MSDAWSRVVAVFGEPLAGQYLQWLLAGFGLTVGLSVLVCVFGAALGLGLCVLRLESGAGVRVRLGRGAAGAFLSVFRNTPLLVQLFVWYFGVAAVLPEGWMGWLNTPRSIAMPGGWELPAPSFEFLAALWGLVLYTAAFMAEEFRAGVQSVGAAQRQAAAALGMREGQIWRHVVLPQAWRNAFAPLVGQCMNAAKNTSLAMAIGLAELSYASRQVETETFQTFQAFGIATLLYVVLIVCMELASLGAQRSRCFAHRSQHTRAFV